MTRTLTRLALAYAFIAMTVACGSPNQTTDASGPSQHDAAPPTGEFGDECTNHGDCISGYCVEAVGGVGGVCTRPCNDDCPADWNCRDVHLGSETVKLCVPNAPQLCLACATDTECGAEAACLTIDGTGSCATKCTTACPTGYKCVVDATSTHPGTFCQPVIGSCTCNAAMEGASRACTNTNAIGTCYGTQMCATSTGWSNCTARTASTETCDGIDDDCDFLIDEDVGGGQACTNTVVGVGSCPGTRTCSGAGGFVCEGQIPTVEVCNNADDNCNGSSDETFPGVGTLCSPGVGACQRFGSIACNSAGTGTVCSVTAGSPTAELCNHIDDDCDTLVDEPFTTLGTTCSAGNGICTRFGTTICASSGLTTTCSATPAMVATTETCNYLDDNCDGFVDNGFRNMTTGAYDMTPNCGSCGNNCAAVYTGANSTGVCSTGSGSPQCLMVCNAGTFDLDSSSANGCEFVLDATSVYVSTSEALAVDDSSCGLGPTGTGTGNHPCKTITFGITRATALARANVRVADGTYEEAVAMVSGKQLFGGYRAGTWDRHLATTNTVVQGATSMGNHDSTVTAISISNATLEGFVVRGSFNTKPGGNSYAIYISGGATTLAIRDNKIFAGRGGPGGAGAAGANGPTGVNGGGSVSGSYDGYIATGTGFCNVSNNRQYVNGGVRSCGANNVNGGAGGGNRCTPASDYTQFSAINGFTGNAGAAPGGGAGGGGAQAGFDGTLEIQGQNSTCFVPVPPMSGADGAPGQVGAHGPAVAGCSAAGGSIVSSHWVNGTAAVGTIGSNGGGGGGGGAGGGGYCSACGGNGKDRLGAHGGGGGSGGCGGTGGNPGSAGGGVFGIFIVGGSPPAISNNSIQRGAGGVGGDGGIGGAGGQGGSGGDGGAAVLLCSAKAGRGGDGGAAGHGSGGGGGCGGSSFAIFTSGIGTPMYCGTNPVSGGSGGSGGAGGFSGGNSGGNGVAGVLQGCTSI